MLMGIGNEIMRRNGVCHGSNGYLSVLMFNERKASASGQESSPWLTHIE